MSLAILDRITNRLESTASYADRRYVWTPDAERITRIGQLKIVADHARRNQVDTTVYDVLETDSPHRVELCNIETGECYTVTIPLPRTCTCRAGQFGKPCKHVDAIADLLLEEPGALEVRVPAP